MAENMYNSDHKSWTPKGRDNWDDTFRKPTVKEMIDIFDPDKPRVWHCECGFFNKPEQTRCAQCGYNRTD